MFITMIHIRILFINRKYDNWSKLFFLRMYTSIEGIKEILKITNIYMCWHRPVIPAERQDSGRTRNLRPLWTT